MTGSYEHLVTALRDRTALVHLDVEPPRDAPARRFVAFLFEAAPGEPRPPRPQGQAVAVAITADQARELLSAGAEWKGPSHMRADLFPIT